MNCLTNFTTPQLRKIHQGKVRDSIRINDKIRMIVVTDRISAFDKVLKTPIENKGAILNGIANFWFEKTKNIIDNHLIKEVDPNINLVKEVLPIRVEMIVRGYLTGSMWRGYEKGKREFSGVKVNDGLKQNDKFEMPIITPTTKEDSDREITPTDIIKTGLIDEQTYKKMEKISIELFNLGTKILEEKGIILVDTKYEFGLLDGKLILIDEIHTPDSSRFWYLRDYKKNPLQVAQIDKENVRQWLLNNMIDGKYADCLPDDVVMDTTKRYLEIYETIIGKPFHIDKVDIKQRMYQNLVYEGIIKDGYVAIVMGSASDLEYCKEIANHIEKYDVMTDLRVVSAHKNGEDIINIAYEYNDSIEPGVVIAVAGRSNGLGGALGANLNIPVINCPPFKDSLDMLVNINSSLIMPSKTPTATIISPENAANMALRSLNILRLRNIFTEEIREMKKSLRKDDIKIRGH